MTSRAGPPGSEADTEQAELNRLLLEGVAPVPPAAPQRQGWRAQLLARVARSAAEHAGLVTVRQKDGAWRSLRPGIRFKELWRGAAGRSVLLEFAPGTALPPHRHRWLEEGIVLRGGLQMGELDLGPRDYHLSPPGSRHARIRSRQGALAYLRGTSLGDPASVWRELLGGVLPFGGGASRTVYGAGREDWVEVAEGVERKELQRGGGLVSCFYRLLPGACLDGHGHPRDEECMILEGEVFLGDILLREGDYQLAPAGSRHGEVTTDVGALLFVRGAAEED